MEETTNIGSLPDEVILLILQNLSHVDCNNFRKTCHRYNDLLKHNNGFWRVIYRNTVGEVIYNVTAYHSCGDWLSDLMGYLSLKTQVHDIIGDMSAKHFREVRKGLSINDVMKMFGIALCTNTHYYITITILQDFIKKANQKINSYKTDKPYTLTEIHYAKISLCYLSHTLFAIKWVQLHLQEELHPDVVLNFFMQWIDPTEIRREEEVVDLINSLIYDVEVLLAGRNQARYRHLVPGVDTQYTCPKGVYTDIQILSAISHYLYKERRAVLMEVANMDTLDIVKTVKSNCGHALTWGSIYQAIARGFGVNTCSLIAFPSHMYLEWRYNRQKLIISLDKGELRPSRSCPFSGNAPHYNNYSYSPDTFLQYAITAFLRPQGEYSTWYTENASHLLDFITNNRNSEYFNFIGMLRACAREPGMSMPFTMEYIPREHKEYVLRLMRLNRTPPRIQYRDLTVKHHTSALKFTVGMICYHKKFEYLCVVRDWDFECVNEFKYREQNKSLTLGPKQPFYHLIAIDQSDKYIAQEFLIFVANPPRLYHLEHRLGKEFTHFNGFFYEPNAEKRGIYPDDMAIANMYAEKAHARLGANPVNK